MNYANEIYNIQKNVWIDANAGSGKTTALVYRYVSLLLSGVSHENIYCITYTNVGAFEMKTRIRSILEKWSKIEDDVLISELQVIYENVTNDILTQARSLHSKIINSLVDLKISTIHSFAQQLIFFHNSSLQQVEDKGIEEIALNALQEYKNSNHKDKYFELAKLIEKNPDKILIDVLCNYFLYCDYLKQHSIKDDAEFFNELQQIKFIKTGNGKTIDSVIFGVKKARNLNEAWEELLTKSGTVKRLKMDNLHEIEDIYEDFLINNSKKAINLLHYVISAILPIFITKKNSQAVISFTESLHLAKNIIQENSFSDIRYYTDINIHHIMIDESQDTNPVAWSIISTITEDFFSGITSSDEIKTIFCVGDFKQSIFSFQGADVEVAKSYKRYFQNKSLASGIDFLDYKLSKTYRCGEHIIHLVNQLVKNDDYTHAFDSESLYHESASNRTGKIEFNTFFINENKKTKDINWVEMYHNECKKSDFSVVTERVKNIIQEHCDKEILILYPSRNDSMNALQTIIASLINENIPISGIDRIDIASTICFYDIVNLLKTISNPFFDDSLILLLRSPFFNISMNDTIDFISSSNRKISFFENIDTQLFIKNEIKMAKEQILKWIQLFQEKTILEGLLQILHEYFDILVNHYGKDLYLCVDFIISKMKSIPIEKQFSIDFIVEGLNEIHDDYKTNQINNRIKISTIHGSKGSEADVVILLENKSILAQDVSMDYLELCEDEIFFTGGNGKQIKKIVETKEKKRKLQQKEKIRLLYVALTRAKESLYVISLVKEEESIASQLQKLL